ncbi:hypothetical protein D3C79_615080 [compost metagenome]
MLEGVGLHIFRSLVIWIGKDHVVYNLGHPAEVTLVVILLGFFQYGISSTHHVDETLGLFLRWQLPKGGGVADKPTQVQNVSGLDVVVQRAVIAAVGEAVGN